MAIFEMAVNAEDPVQLNLHVSASGFNEILRAARRRSPEPQLWLSVCACFHGDLLMHNSSLPSVMRINHTTYNTIFQMYSVFIIRDKLRKLAMLMRKKMPQNLACYFASNHCIKCKISKQEWLIYRCTKTLCKQMIYILHNTEK